MRLNILDRIAYILTIIGGLNWGLVGLFNYNLVASIFGEDSTVTRLIYTLVGLGALYLILTAIKHEHNEVAGARLRHSRDAH